jgi:hypothetical protein
MRAFGTLLVILVLSSSAHADDADQLFTEGRAMLDANNPKEACEKFERAQKLKPSSVAIQLNLGLCNEKQNKLAAARRWYVKTLATAAESKEPGSKDYVDAATEANTKLKEQVATVAITWSPGAEQVSVFVNTVKVVDRNVPVEVDEGDVEIQARQEGKTKMVTTLKVKNGEHPTHTVAPLADAPDVEGAKRSKRRLIGVGIAGGTILVATAVTGLLAKSNANDFGKDGEDEDGHRRKMRIYTGIWVGAAVLGVAAGSYFFFTKPKIKQDEVTRFFPVVSPTDVGVAAIRRF